ncbi:MAG: HD domain-containing protein [Magnetococcales bacterium]|nr:HD domain-containing protein [Magnetococcales bacterium]
MKFNLNRYLFGLSLALDCVESELLGVTTYHGLRVAYVAVRLARLLGLSDREVFDLAAFAILHDNGLAEESLTQNLPVRGRLDGVEAAALHCTIGESNIAAFPFQTSVRGIVEYHHEHWDGSGFFDLRGDEIPLMAQIVGLADYADLRCRFAEAASRACVQAFLDDTSGRTFSPHLVDAFRQASASTAFWLDLRDPFIHAGLHRVMPEMSLELGWREVLEISRVFSKIIDSKSRFTSRHSRGLEEKTAHMADHFALDDETKTRLRIAASLHDVGKLAMPNAILDKPGRLTDDERQKMSEHTYYTRICLEPIPDFGQITEWASNHHEKLNGRGYPLGLAADQLDPWSRLLTVLDIYQALTEERPYRQPLPHSQVMAMLERMSREGELDGGMVAAVGWALS